MSKHKATRWVAGGGLAILTLALWPSFSEWWLGVLKAAVLPLSEGRPVYGPSTASVVLPVAIGVTLLLDIPWAKKLGTVLVATVATLSLEMILVAVGALVNSPGEVTRLLGAAVQDVTPVAAVVLLGGVRLRGEKSTV